MRTSSQPRTALRLAWNAGFTLVEVVLAISVVSVAFVGLFALLPTGLGLFRQAMDTSLGAQIAQRVVSDVEQTDFDSYVPGTSNALPDVITGGSNSQYYRHALRYFDDQGSELDATKPSEMTRMIYTVRVRGSKPGVADPAQHSNSTFTSLPSSGDRYNPRAMTFLTIQVIKNPARKSVESFVDQDTFLITAAAARTQHLPLQTYSAVVARNGYRKSSGL